MIVNEGNKDKSKVAEAAAVVASPVVAEVAKTETVAVPVFPAATEPSATDLKSLLELLVKREVRLSQKEAEENARVEARQVQRKKSGEGSQVNKMLEQANCPHRKGGKLLGAQIDHCVALHSFIDGTRRISCHRCGARWFPNDTRTTLYVDHGGEILPRPNHTGRSWADAVLMASQSTNKPTSSERVTFGADGMGKFATMSNDQAAEALRDRANANPAGLPIEPRI